MSKEFLSKCPEVIYEAETARTAGQYKLASLKVRGARDGHPRGVVHLEDSQISDLMRAWRIDVVANTSAAKRSWNGRKAIEHLREAQDVIKNYYDYPAVQHRASQIKKDNEDNPYDFEVEMLRDRARYCLAAAAITGDSSFRIAGAEFINKAINLAEEMTVMGLTIMEAGIVNNDWWRIHNGYKATHYLSADMGNFDRARWAARTYFGESLKRGRMIQSLRALKDLHKIRRSFSKTAADAVIGLTRSSEFLSAPLNFVRRRTLPKNFNSESLKIS